MTMLAKFNDMPKDLFIETGTNIGNTLAHASRYFDRCVSIEQNESYHRAAIKKFEHVSNVKVIHGMSHNVLPQVIEPNTPTTFWLDAHYSAHAITLAPEGGECPLMRELGIITRTPWTVRPLILIDDAFMFDDSVPHPGSIYPFWTSNEADHTVYHRNQWPRVEEIDEILLGWKRSLLSGEYAFRYDWRG